MTILGQQPLGVDLPVESRDTDFKAGSDGGIQMGSQLLVFFSYELIQELASQVCGYKRRRSDMFVTIQ